jgi:hypothetical protein
MRLIQLRMYFQDNRAITVATIRAQRNCVGEDADDPPPFTAAILQWLQLQKYLFYTPKFNQF